MITHNPTVGSSSQPATRPHWLSERLFPFQSRFLELDESVIHYVDEGEGPPLLFVHPAPASSFMYREFIRRLRGRFRCVALDYPGFGLSTAKPGFRWTLEELADCVARFVSALDLRDVTVLVHDSGGPIGFGAALREPERYRSFIVSDTLAFPMTRYLPMRAMLHVVTSRPFRALNRRYNLLPRVVARLAPVRRRLSMEERAVYRHLFPTPESRDRILTIFRQLLDRSDYLGRVEVGLRASLCDRPALLMYGQFDPARIMGWVRRFCGIFPDHRVVTIPWEGHFPHEGSPERMIGEIEDWYASVVAPRSGRR